MWSPFFLLLSCSSLVVAGLRPVIFSFFSVASAFSVTSVWISYFLLLRFRRRSTNLFPLLTPPEHCFSHALHRPLRDCSRFIRTGIQDFEHALWVVLPFHAALADWGDPLDQILGHGGLALDAADPGGRATLPHPLQPARLFRREQ